MPKKNYQFKQNVPGKVLEILQNIKKTGHGSVTYHFHGGRMQSQQINPNIFKDEKGKDLKLTDVVHLFNDIKSDLGAKNYRLKTSKLNKNEN